jgi:translation initiation factor IF-2
LDVAEKKVKKKRIYEVAREFNVSSDAVIKVLKELEYEVKNHMSTVTPEMAEAIGKRFTEAQAEAKVEDTKRKEVHAAMKQHAAERERAKREARAKDVQARTERKPAEKAPARPDSEAPRPKATGTRKTGTTTARRTQAARSSTQPRPPAPSQRPEPPTRRTTDREGGRSESRRQKGRRKSQVDQREVRQSYQRTMAELEGPRRRRRRRSQDGSVATDEHENVIQVVEMMPLQDLAAELGVRPPELIAKLMKDGVLATMNQRLDRDTIEILAADYDKEIEWISEFEETEAEVDDSSLEAVPRPPVVTVMGHVDHGKTSVLDFIRKTNVVAGESGGITQHIGAYEVTTTAGHRLTFLDTPGHEAFTAMRSRGAQVTDLVIIVVAANDGVMPQTLEAINHARAAGVPFMVAINKIDLPEANIDRVKQQLSQHNVLLEDWGGNIVSVEVSAKTGQGIDTLLEMIHLQAELLDLRAPVEGHARGIVLEAKKSAQHGVVVNMLMQAGTLRVGDVFVAGRYSGRVRALLDERSNRRSDAKPADPVQLLGCDGVPQAGDPFQVVEHERQAREIASKRQQYERAREAKLHQHVTLEQLYAQIQGGGLAELKVILKADVDGTIEALTDSLEKLSTSEVKVLVIHRAVGGINESDVQLAIASNAVIIGFHVRPTPQARDLARREKIDMHMYDVIYEVVEDVKKAMEGLLTPEKREVIDGNAEVRDLFRVPRVGTIAGSFVTSGKILRGAQVRVIRDQIVLYESTVSSLKRFKDDVREVLQNFECGIGVEGFDDLKVGDILEVYHVEEIARTL